MTKIKNFPCDLRKLQQLLLLQLLLPLLLQFGQNVHHNNFVLADNCNEYVCGSVVSKCLLTQACQCKLTDCHCCQDCLKCMGDLFVECCACLDMCPKRNDTFSAHAPKSQIGDFEGVPELFDSLTAEDDDEEWTTIRFPMRANLRNRFGNTNNKNSNNNNNRGNSRTSSGDAIDRHASLQKTTLNVNCTVIYLNACTTNKKCTEYCLSMGANSYRWFHDGCCECVGANCFNYGINESRCAACPDDEDIDAEGDDGDYGGGNIDEELGDGDDDEMSNWDYGEEEINYN